MSRDPHLDQGEALPRREFLDHIPALLEAFEDSLRQLAPDEADIKGPASAHGLQRWRQGYDLREMTRELAQLNKCVVGEFESLLGSGSINVTAIAHGFQMWSDLCGRAIEESVARYVDMQQQEAEGHANDLERALKDLRELESNRADLWHETAHDLRGNLGVVAHAAVGLAKHEKDETRKRKFSDILKRNIDSLHQLLNDATSLARLQAGRERREISDIEVSAMLESFSQSVGPLAEQKGLALTYSGTEHLRVQGDAVKILRITQNLVLNAIKYTRQGGIAITWSDIGPADPDRWELAVADSGPGLPAYSGQPIVAMLRPEQEPLEPAAPTAEPAPRQPTEQLPREAGEGIGLSIVKRLCELLNASVEVQSTRDVGTTVRVLFPKRYSG